MIKYQAHIQDVGWQPNVSDGMIAGTIHQSKRMEAYIIHDTGVPGLGVHAFAYQQDTGWTAGNTLGQIVGSVGEAKRIEAIKIGLIGAPDIVNQYDLFYRLHVENYGFLNWSKNGEINGTVGGGLRAEAMQIILVKKGTNVYPIVDTPQAFIDLTPTTPPAPRTDNKRESALALARSYVGYQAEDDSIFGRRYGGVNAGAWCCYSVRSICEDCGIEFPPTGYVPDAEDWAKETGRFTTQVDLNRLQAILFDFNESGGSDHIGLVETVENGMVITLEGNTSGPNGEPNGYWRKERNSYIFGYINLT